MFLTCYAPVRHWGIATPVRLACVRHAASVRPEPGSNSPMRFEQLNANDLVLSSESRLIRVKTLPQWPLRPLGSEGPHSITACSHHLSKSVGCPASHKFPPEPLSIAGA